MQEHEYAASENLIFSCCDTVDICSLVRRRLLFFLTWQPPPLPKVDENMRRAHERDAATKGKFFFRSNIDYAQSPEGGEAGEIYSPCDNDPQSGLEEMTVLQILEGKVGSRLFCLWYFT